MAMFTAPVAVNRWFSTSGHIKQTGKVNKTRLPGRILCAGVTRPLPFSARFLLYY